MKFYEEQEKARRSGRLPEKHFRYFTDLYEAYKGALAKDGIRIEPYDPLFLTILEKVIENIESPFVFAPYHRQLLVPFDYYKLGLDFIRPLVDFERSTVSGTDRLAEISRKLSSGENVIFLANHQIEADPQAISILLEESHPKMAKEMIFVAGERVVLDPFAIPFSMGRNLLCIYSKRHIDHPPELKAQKQLHNKKTLELMSELLSEGGHCIYVAPSGGRDRPDSSGNIPVAKFDGQSIELFHLMAQRASKRTAFHPMALSTYHLLPPPEQVEVELGEARVTNRGPIHLWVGPEISMDNFPGSEESDKKRKRELRAESIRNLVQAAYDRFPK